jgi:predicted AAA+ superfamily ATPase
VDKVLLRDLPSLYGIKDVQELNSLFTTIAFNTANEFSCETLSVQSGVDKKTIKIYIEYLEAAFLIKKIQRVDQSGKRFEREISFKLYLTNPSLFTALFAPI